MIKNFFIFLIFCFCLNSFSQTKKLYLIKENNLYGFIDNTGKKVIAPKFEKAFPFYDGLAAVKINNLYGYIDMKGKIVIKPKYKHAYNFYNGIAKTIIEKDTIYITKKDEKLAVSYIDNIYKFNNDNFIFETKSNKYGIFDISENKIIADTTKNWITSLSDKSYAECTFLENKLKNKKDSTLDFQTKFYDLKTKLEIKTDEELYCMYDINYTSYNFNSDHLFVDENGKTILNLSNLFSKEKTIPKIRFFDNENNYKILDSVGIINKKGEFVLKTDEKSYISKLTFNKFYIKHKNGKFDVLDKNFNNKIKETRSIPVFYNQFTVISENSQYKIYNNNFELINTSKYESVIPINNNYFFFRKSEKGKYGISNYNNEVLVDEIIDFIYCDETYTYAIKKIYYHENLSDLVKVKINNLEAYINEFGKIIWTETNNTHTTILNEHKNISFVGEKEIVLIPKESANCFKSHDLTFEIIETDNNYLTRIYNSTDKPIDLSGSELDLSIRMVFEKETSTNYDSSSISNILLLDEQKENIIKPNHYFEFQLKKTSGNLDGQISVEVYTNVKRDENSPYYDFRIGGNILKLPTSVDLDILDKKDFVENNNFFEIDEFYYD